MHLHVYEIAATPDRLIYWFTSEGPKGNVLKAIVYQPLSLPNRFNFGFGDVEPDGNISDAAITGNADLRKVMGTVAKTLYSFFAQYPDKTVQFEGTDTRRNIMYFRAIRDYRLEVERDFIFEGRRQDGFWEPFNPAQDYNEYNAFTVRLNPLTYGNDSIEETVF